MRSGAAALAAPDLAWRVARAKAGVADPKAVASSLRDAATLAETKLEAAVKSFRRFESTAAIAAAKGAATYLKAFPQKAAMKDGFTKRAERLTEIHRIRFAPKSAIKKGAKK